MLLMVEWRSWFATLAPAKTKQIENDKMENGNPFGGLTCTILDTIVCVRGSVCESDERGEGGWRGGREKRGQENDSSSFFHYIISLKDTTRGDGKETWQYHTARNKNLSCLFSLADWLIRRKTGSECSPLVTATGSGFNEKAGSSPERTDGHLNGHHLFLHVHSYCFHLR